MNEVYIDMRKENEWIKKYFTKDLVNIEDLLACIEELDGEVENLKEQIEDMKSSNKKDYYDEWEDHCLEDNIYNV